jgi:hypothetical protein
MDQPSFVTMSDDPNFFLWAIIIEKSVGSQQAWHFVGLQSAFSINVLIFWGTDLTEFN